MGVCSWEESKIGEGRARDDVNVGKRSKVGDGKKKSNLIEAKLCGVSSTRN